MRVLGLAALILLLAGCAASPEASRVPGQPGADVGNHGNPIQLHGGENPVETIYYDIPYEGPPGTSPDTSLS